MNPLNPKYFYLEFQNDVDTFMVKKMGVRGESLEPEEEVITDNDPKQRMVSQVFWRRIWY